MTMHASSDAGALDQVNTEIRGAVNALLGLTDLLLDTPLDAMQREYVDVLRSTADRLLSIGADAASMKRGSAQPQSFVHIDLRETVLQVADLTRAIAANRGLTVETNFSGTAESSLLADRQYIEQGLMSVAKVCTSAPGVGRLHIEADRPTADRIRLSVRALRNADYRRAGTPVTVDARAAQRHVDALHVEQSTDGVTLSFLAPAQPASECSCDPQANGSRRRVLLVEDATDNQFIVRAFLRSEPYDLDIVGCGEDAVQRVRTAAYDIVLMDLEMPGMNGVEATRAIREWERDRAGAGIPVVALTARSGPEEAANCLALGFSGFLSKPVSKSALLSTLKSYFSPVQ